MKPAILPQWLLAVSATPPVANYLLFGGADNEANNTAAVALLAVSATLPVVYSSVVGGLRNEATIPQLPLAVSATCQWQLPAVFGGADNEANNTAAVATGGVINSASGVYSSVVGGLQ
jgi:hypothetical protein